MKKGSLNLSSLDDVEIYKLILDRKMRCFPRGFWEKPEAFHSAKEITLYLFEERLKWSNEEIKKSLNQNTFFDNKLRGMLNTLFKNSPYEALNNAYPDKFKEWELPITPWNFWNEKTAYELVKWLIEKKYKWSSDEIKKNFSKTSLIKLGYDRAMDFIKEDTYGIIEKLYPGKYKPWELKQVAINYWTEETMAAAIKWLIEEKININIYEKKIKITNNLLETNGLGRLADYIYKNKISLDTIINVAYPKIKQWEIENMKEWTIEKKIDAIKWLVEKKLKLDPSKDLHKVVTRNFQENGLSGLLSSCNNSPKEALKLAYNIYI